MDRVVVRTILIPIDFSDGSFEALRYGMALAEMFSARVIVLHVIEPPPYGLDVPPTGPVPDPAVIRHIAATINDCVDEVRLPGLEVAWEIQIGMAFSEIRAAIERHHADLVVMGTHGRTGVAHVVFGSVAERVVQRAPCPVLTVKAPPSSATGKTGAARETRRASEKHAPEPQHRVAVCYLCGQPSSETICETCKIKVQAEAVAGKLKAEREGRIPLGRL